MNLRFSLVILLLLSMYAVHGQDKYSTDFAQANEAYQQKDFKTAIQRYKVLVDKELQSSELFYNLGNSYYKNGELGKAILYYEKAAVLEPGDAELQHNLELLRQQQVDELSSVGSTPMQWWYNLVSILSTTAWTILALLVFWLAIGGFVTWLLAKERSQRKKGFLGGLVGLGIAGLLMVFAYAKNNLEVYSKQGILVSPQTELKIAPDVDSEKISTVHQGLKLVLLDKIGAWYKVRLINGDEGWLPEEVIGQI